MADPVTLTATSFRCLDLTCAPKAIKITHFLSIVTRAVTGVHWGEMSDYGLPA